MSEILKDAFSINDLAIFGDGVLAYIKPISVDDAKNIIGEMGEVPVDIKLFCLFSANGTPLAISDSPKTAFENAIDHDLEPIFLH